jgi:hypothetical protein
MQTRAQIMPEQPEVDEADPKDRLTKVGHAIALLSNHLPCFGVRNEDGEDFKPTQPFMHDVPAEVMAPLVRALSSAGWYIARYFEGK